MRAKVAVYFEAGPKDSFESGWFQGEVSRVSTGLVVVEFDDGAVHFDGVSAAQLSRTNYGRTAMWVLPAEVDSLAELAERLCELRRTITGSPSHRRGCRQGMHSPDDKCNCSASPDPNPHPIPLTLSTL